MANRPLSLNDYIGQERAKAQLQVTMGACRRNGKALPHMLLAGNAGLGKTTLAQIIANEFGVELHEVMASSLNSAEDVEAVLYKATRGDAPNILFIDEIHRLTMKIEELLYPVMEDSIFEKEIRVNGQKQMQRYRVRPLTIIAATTLAGDLSRPLRDRFGIHFQLQDYNIAQLVQIIDKLADREGASITKEAKVEIAQRSKGTARIAINFFNRCREYAEFITDHGMIDKEVAQSQFSLMGIDSMGLDENDYRVLYFLANQSRPIGLDALVSGVDIDKPTIANIIEPYMVQTGLIQRHARGREITQKGIDWIMNNSVDLEQGLLEQVSNQVELPLLGE